MDIITYALCKKLIKTSIEELGDIFTLKGNVASVDQLPSTGNQPGDIYFVGPNEHGSYDEYYWSSNNTWEIMGSTGPGFDGIITDEIMYKGQDGTGTLEEPAEDTILYEVNNAINTKQDNLTPGSNISIVNNTISATDTTYESKNAVSGGSDVSLVTTGEKYVWNNKGTYSKPNTGIPDTDLSSTVQTSLGLANTALQGDSILDATKLDGTIPSSCYTDTTYTAGTNINITNNAISVDGSVIKDLPFSNEIFICDLEPGIYSIKNNSTLYFNGHTTTGGSGLQPEGQPYLFVYGSHSTRKYWTLIAGSNGTDNILFSGCTDTNSGYIKMLDLDYRRYQQVKNLVTSISASSTNDQYPSAKLLYNKLAEKQSELDDLYAQIPTATITGEYINIQDSSNLSFKDFKLKGNCSKNLFNKDTANILNAYINDGTSTIIDSNKSRIIYISCKPNTTYTISKTQATARFVIGTTTNIPITTAVCNQVIANNTATSITITTGNNDNYLCAFIYHSDDDSPLTLEQVLSYIQIELGSTATAYEAYKNVTGDNTLKVAGRNIMPKITNETKAIRGVTVTVKDNVIHITGQLDGTGSYNYTFSLDSSFVLPAGTYMHFRNNVANANITAGLVFDGVGGDPFIISPINRIFASTNSKIGKTAIGFNIYISSGMTNVLDITLTPSLELTNDVTDFVPYTLQEQLLSLGDIQLDPTDEIAKVNNEWCKNTTPITDTTLISQLENVLAMHTNKNVTNACIKPTGTNAQADLTLTYRQDLQTKLNQINNLEARLTLLET